MKALAKLRQFRTNLDPAKYMTNEHRQNLLSIEESFRAVNTKNFSVSSLCDSFSNTSGDYQNITNLSVEITTTGGPVLLGITEEYSSSSDTGIINASNCKIKITRININKEATDITVRPIVNSASLQSVSFTYFDPIGAGTYTYQAKLTASAGTVTNLKLFALENK